LAERAKVMAAQKAAGAAPTGMPIPRLAKEELFDLVPIVRGIVARFQTAAYATPPDMPNADLAAWQRLKEWLEFFSHLCYRAADFQSPKFRAISVSMPGTAEPKPVTIDAEAESLDPAERVERASRTYLALIKGGRAA
jgi:hypothetical protein